MKKSLPLAGIVLSLAALTGCVQTVPGTGATTDDSTAAEGSAESTPTEETPSEPAEDLSPRGNYVQEVGQSAGIFAEADPDNDIVGFTVTGIETDPVCTSSYAQKPENGHFIKVDIEAETGTAEQFEEYFYGQDFQFNPHSWKFISTDGTTANSVASGPSYGCLAESELLPDMIGPAEEVSGSLMLDVPATEGTLIFEEMMTDLGWEWEIPAA